MQALMQLMQVLTDAGTDVGTDADTDAGTDVGLMQVRLNVRWLRSTWESWDHLKVLCKWLAPTRVQECTDKFKTPP